MYFMSDPQTLHVTRNVIPGKLGVDLHLHRVHIPLVLFEFRLFHIRTFRLSAPSLWNSLPQAVLISDSLSVFKSSFHWTLIRPAASASEVTTIWRYINLIIIMIITIIIFNNNISVFWQCWFVDGNGVRHVKTRTSSPQMFFERPMGAPACLSILTSFFHVDRSWVIRWQNVFILDFIGAKDDGGDGDNWSYKTCKAAVTWSPPTNQCLTFNGPYALPVT